MPKPKPKPQPLDGPIKHLYELLHSPPGEPEPEWDIAFEKWFAERYPAGLWANGGLNYGWMKHAALSAILWTSGMLPEDDKVFDL